MNAQKSTKEVLGDYVKEIIGYDNGLWRTVVDLRKDPAMVLKGYLEKDQRYVSPFRILISALSLWVLVNSFFLDWYRVFEGLMQQLAAWMQNVVTIPPENQAKFDKFVVESGKLYGRLGGDLFSKYYVPFVLIGLPLGCYFATRKKKVNVEFKIILSALAYSFTLNVLVMFVVSIAAYFSVALAFVFIILPLFVLQLLGKGNLVAFLPLRRFFPERGVEIEKEVTKSLILSTFILMMPGMIYFFYYVFFVLIRE